MNREKLSDELSYRFIPPRPGHPWLGLGRLYARKVYLPGPCRVAAIELDGLDRLKELATRGDGILITPNHPDHADAAVMLDVGRRAGLPFHFMAAYQMFHGHGKLARFLFPRVGAFPVDREGADLQAFKAGVDIVGSGRGPLVIFPEGEIYHTCDRLTPIREGAAAVATSAAKRAAERGRTVWLVPAAIKYRFLDGLDPLPSLTRTMADLEARFTWWPRSTSSLVDRIYAYAEGLLVLKEIEYFGSCQTGPLRDRIVRLRDAILDHLERFGGRPRPGEDIPVRVKEIRRGRLERLANPETTEGEKALIRRDLHDVFVAVQLFSYPGDYLRDAPTVERVAETLTKFTQDVLGSEPEAPAPRRAIVRLGEPIDIRERMAAHAKPRLAVGAITEELEAAIQGMLDRICPGRPLPPDPPELEPMRPRLRAGPNPDHEAVGQVPSAGS